MKLAFKETKSGVRLSLCKYVRVRRYKAVNDGYAGLLKTTVLD